MARGIKTGGRKAGTPNKVNASLRELAREYTAEAVAKLVSVMRTSDSDAAIVSAVNTILDRGYGKPSQVLSGDEDGGAIRTENVTTLSVEGLNADQLRALASIRVPAG